MTRIVYTDGNMDLSRFYVVEARNALLEFETVALQVTKKNILNLAIHLGSDLRDRGSTFAILVARGEKAETYLTFRLTDWIVFIGGEVKCITNERFRSAFTFDELVEYRCSVCGKISGDNKAGSYGEKHVAHAIARFGWRKNFLRPCDMSVRV